MESFTIIFFQYNVTYMTYSMVKQLIVLHSLQYII